MVMRTMSQNGNVQTEAELNTKDHSSKLITKALSQALETKVTTETDKSHDNNFLQKTPLVIYTAILSFLDYRSLVRLQCASRYQINEFAKQINKNIVDRRRKDFLIASTRMEIHGNKLVVQNSSKAYILNLETIFKGKVPFAYFKITYSMSSIKQMATLYSTGYPNVTFFFTGNHIVYPDGKKLQGLEKVAVSQVFSTSRSNVFFTSDQGVVFACGSNSLGKFGTGKNLYPSYDRAIKILTLKGIVIKQVAGCFAQTFFLSDQGVVYGCGAVLDCWKGLGYEGGFSVMEKLYLISNRPKKLTTLSNIFVRKIITNDSEDLGCVFFLADEGVFAYGDNSHGQFGVDHNNVCSAPTKVKIPNNYIVKNLIVIGASIFMITNDGVFAWGDNRHGQLGLGHNARCYSPTKIELLSHVVVHRIIGVKNTDYCKVRGIFFITDQGVYASGSNRNGQLGLGEELSYHYPVKIEGFPGPVVDIVADEECTLFLADNVEKLELYVCGLSRHFRVNSRVVVCVFDMPPGYYKFTTKEDYVSWKAQIESESKVDSTAASESHRCVIC